LAVRRYHAGVTPRYDLCRRAWLRYGVPCLRWGSLALSIVCAVGVLTLIAGAASRPSERGPYVDALWVSPVKGVAFQQGVAVDWNVSLSGGASRGGGGTGWLTATVVSGQVPPGLYFVKDPADQAFGPWWLRGTPTEGGTYSFRVRFVDVPGVPDLTAESDWVLTVQ